MAVEPVGSGVSVPGRRGSARAVAAGVALLVAALLLAGVSIPPARATTSMGTGILSVDGETTLNFTLLPEGTYYLVVAADGPGAYMNASLTYNGSLLAQENATVRGATFASLPAGAYSLSVAGHGRAALAWDFTNGVQQNFPANESLVAFLNPSGPRIRIDVSRADVAAVGFSLFDDALRPVGNATLAADGQATFDLDPSHASAAVLVVRPSGGNPSGVYGLAWTSGPTNPPLDFTSWPLFLLWILVPVAIALVVFVLVQRRSRR